jgi:cation diffusion facilitator family transporter
MAAHAHDLSAFAHEHVFADERRGARQRALGWVALLTLATMAVELAAGWWSGSLALAADGWHMGTHAFALGGAWLAYRLARRAGAGYAFGGWKIEVLAAYTSGLMLLAAAAWIVVDAVLRLLEPAAVDYSSALLVALIGLAVNLASAWLLLRGGNLRVQAHAHEHEHQHEHEHEPEHEHEHQRHRARQVRIPAHDHNYHAALVHVVADALTSVLAIVALAGGAWFGWGWLDPAVALVGALVIGRWAFGVLRASARALVDATADPQLVQTIRSAIESDGDARVTDLHVWQVGSAAWSGAVSVVAGAPLAAGAYRQRLGAISTLRHVTVEVHRCPTCEPR